MQKLKIGDQVKVILGKEKGEIGTIKSLFYKKQKVIVEGINVKIKHIKSNQKEKSGKIVKFEAPIDLSNVMICNSEGISSRVNFRIEADEKVRFYTKTKELIS